MSSFLSTAYTPTEIESTFNTPLAMKVMAMKQGTYDANKSKVDQTMALYKEKLKGLRDSDNEYISEKLNSLKSTLEQYGNKDYSLSSTTSDATAHIMSVLDDPIVRNAITNKTKYDTAITEIAAKKKKGEGTYSDDNFNDWQDQIGYTAYMKGEAKSLKSSEYVDYYDPKKNLTDSVEKYAKERGYTKVLSEVGDGYTYKTVKGVSVPREEIESYIKTTILTDSKLKSQLEINSRARYRGISDDVVREKYSGFAKEQETEYNGKIAEVDNTLKNVSKDDTDRITKLKGLQVQLKSQRDAIMASATPENFNRGQVLYESYEKELVNSYANTFAQEPTPTDIDYDDSPTKALKAQGLLNADGTKKTTTTTDGVGQVYEHSRAAPTKEEESDVSKFKKEKQQAYVDLDGYIKKKLISEGKQITQANVDGWYSGVKKAAKEGFDINASGYGSDDIAMYNKIASVNKKTASYTKIAKTNFSEATQASLEGLFGAEKKDLNVEGLRRSMPYTASLITKYKNAEQMSPRERALALHEVAVNAKNTVDGLGDEDKENLQLYINDLEREHKITKTAPTAKSGAQPGFWSGVGDYAMAGVSAGGHVLSSIGAGIISPFRRDEAVAQSDEEFAKEKKAINQRGRVATSAIQSGFGRAFTSDTNLGELQSGDMNMKGKYVDAGKVFVEAAANAKSSIKNEVDKYRANAPKYSSMTLNPSIETDKPYVEQIRSALESNGFKPSKDTFINIDRIEGDKAYIRFSKVDSLQEEGKIPKHFNNDSEESLPLSNIPSNLIKTLRLREADYSSSVTNPSEMKVKYKYSPPKNLDSKLAMEEAYFKNNANQMNEEQARELQTNGINEAHSKVDYLKAAEILPPQLYEEYKKDVNAQYTVQYTRPEGGGRFNAVLMKDGEAVDRFALDKDFNPHMYQMVTVTTVDNHLKKKLIDLISKNK